MGFVARREHLERNNLVVRGRERRGTRGKVAVGMQDERLVGVVREDLYVK